MATHSGTLAWKIPRTEEPGRLQSMGSQNQTQLNDFTFTFHFHALEKEMATHSSVLAWRIPGTGEPGRLPSMGSHRVGHNWSDLAAAYIYTYIYIGFPGGSVVKNPSASGKMQETQFWSLGQEDPLEKEMKTHSWKIPWTEEPGRLLSMGSQKNRTWLSD